MGRQKRAVEAALFLPLLLAIGCGPESASGMSQNQSSCIPNQTLACAWPDSSQGARVCTQAGVLTDCQCNTVRAHLKNTDRVFRSAAMRSAAPPAVYLTVAD
jgi:hypothetical protein